LNLNGAAALEGVTKGKGEEMQHVDGMSAGTGSYDKEWNKGGVLCLSACGLVDSCFINIAELSQHQCSTASTRFGAT